MDRWFGVVVGKGKEGLELMKPTFDNYVSGIYPFAHDFVGYGDI